MTRNVQTLLLMCLALVGRGFAQDTLWIDPNTPGALESTINGDTLANGARANPSRAYGLHKNAVYVQNASIVFRGGTTLRIFGERGGGYPVVQMQPVNGVDPGNVQQANTVEGSIHLDHVYWIAQVTDGFQYNMLFLLTTVNGLPQECVVNDCVTEFIGIDTFNGNAWTAGAKWKFTNCYFRAFFSGLQWWAGRVFCCKEPIDTLWVENCTVSNGGLVFLQQNAVTRFAYFNHNTLINTNKYWLMNSYYQNLYIVNNLFTNQNWVGEDTVNVTTSGQDPNHLLMGTISIDTITTSQLLFPDMIADMSTVALSRLRIFVSNNISWTDTLLNAYYTNRNNDWNNVGPYPLSYLNWGGYGSGPWQVKNIPGFWANSRTLGLFSAYPRNMIMTDNIFTRVDTKTPSIADANVATLMGRWNQSQYVDPAFSPLTNDLLMSSYVPGDKDASTIPGFTSGVKSENGLTSHVAKISDFIESYEQSGSPVLSKIDGFPMGALLWNDSQNATYNPTLSYQLTLQAYQLAASGSGNPDCTIDLAIRDQCGSSGTLRFGYDAKATNGLDPSLGEGELPPPPPVGAFDARFILPVTPAVSSLKDFRPDTGITTSWRLTFQGCGYPFTFSWDSSALPAGSFMLRDELGGIVVNVDMKAQRSYTLTNPGITSLQIVYSANICRNIIVGSGWNIVSTPVTAADSAVSSLYPGAVSSAFWYNNGYVQSTAFRPGRGYWLKFATADTFTICGQPVSPRDVPVHTGWNIIGPFETAASIAAIGSTPTGIVTSNYFGYLNGYSSATSLSAGSGYWVKVAQDGALHLPGGSSKSSQPVIVVNPNWTRMDLTDNAGGGVSLYLGKGQEMTGTYELPPLPPPGVFDARFAGNRFAEAMGKDTHEIQIASGSVPVSLTVSNLQGRKLRLKDAVDGKQVDAVLVEGRAVLIPSGVTRINIEEMQNLPTVYELSQNYPNPFNPTTIIKFALPAASYVTLEVINTLGQRVVTLVDGYWDAGYHQVEFNALNIASGSYFYRIKAGTFVSVKKLVLLK